VIADLWQDLRQGARTLRRAPGFTLLVVLTLGLGIGANTAIFSLVNAVILRPLPVRAPGQLVTFADATRGPSRHLGEPPNEPEGRLSMYTYRFYQRLVAEAHGFEGIVAQEAVVTRSIVGGDDGRSADRADGRCVSANFFGVLGVGAALGRGFLPDDETTLGANPVVVLSHGFWRRRFGGNLRAVGSHLTINGTGYTVVGVMPAGFTGADVGSDTDFWVPITMQAQLTRDGLDPLARYYWSLDVLGRLGPDVSLARAQAEVDLIYRRWLTEDPVGAKSFDKSPEHVLLDSAATGLSPVRGNFREPLLVLLAGVGLLLLIVCLNVAHLLLARALKRQRELSIRTALGASRGRLLRQLLAEGALLAVLGVGVGVLLSRWLGDALVSLAADGEWQRPLVIDVAPDGRVLAFTAGLGLATALVVGLLPAWQASRANVQTALRMTVTSVAGGPRRLASRLLLMSQVAFSLVLLVGAGLLAGTLGKLRQVQTGLDESHVLLATLNTPVAGLDEAEAVTFYGEVQRRVAALPGVRAVGLSLSQLLTGNTYGWPFSSPGQTTGPSDCCTFNMVAAGFFEATGMPVVRGRSLAATDVAGSPRVAVINETAARKLFGSVEAALGKPLRAGRLKDNANPIMEIVGVVRDATGEDLRDPAPPVVYWPAAQGHSLPSHLFLTGLQVRAMGDPALLTEGVRAAVREASSSIPLLEIRTLKRQVERRLLQERLLASLSTAFGLAALFLVSIGLYGVISQWAGQRTSEIGVRMALGATAGGVRWLVLRQAFGLVLIGLGVGVPASLAAVRLLEGMLFGVAPMDPLTVIGSALAMLAVATVAAYLPARRASRIDPMTALRCE
jgi:predicted permease